MKKEYFSVEKDGFYGAYFPNKTKTNKGIILMLGDSIDDRLATSGVKYMQLFNFNCITISPAKKNYGYHNYELEKFGKALDILKQKGCTKFAIAGGSTTGMIALVVSSIYHEITLTIAFTPCDFIMEGFYQDGLDGAKERPGNNESTLTLNGRPLPYLPYAYRHPTYWQMIKKESQEGKDMIASRKLFDESERLHPLKEEELIKVENIKGTIVLVGASDDVLWDTTKYIRRMEERLKTKNHDSTLYSYIYQHGTHFAFPERLIKFMLPIGSSLLVSIAFKAGKKFKKECKKTRIDIDNKLTDIINNW